MPMWVPVIRGENWQPLTCRFPRGARGAWHFCEAPVFLPGKSYCREHYELCYSVGVHTPKRKHRRKPFSLAPLPQTLPACDDEE